MKLDELVVGELYETESGRRAFYAGSRPHLPEVPIFELIDKKSGVHFSLVALPKDYKPKSSNTYWSYQGLEEEFALVTKNN